MKFEKAILWMALGAGLLYLYFLIGPQSNINNAAGGGAMDTEGGN